MTSSGEQGETNAASDLVLVLRSIRCNSSKEDERIFVSTTNCSPQYSKAYLLVCVLDLILQGLLQSENLPPSCFVTEWIDGLNAAFAVIVKMSIARFKVLKNDFYSKE